MDLCHDAQLVWTVLVILWNTGLFYSLSFYGSHFYHSKISIATQVLKMTKSLNFLKGKEILT